MHRVIDERLVESGVFFSSANGPELRASFLKCRASESANFCLFCVPLALPVKSGIMRESAGSMPAGLLLHWVLQAIGKACFHWHSQCHTMGCTE